MKFFLQPEEGQFRGHEIYLEYCKEGLMLGQCIRAYNYGMSSEGEPRFSVGLEGKLYDQDRKLVAPEDVLNGENGWGFEGQRLSLLPEEILLNLYIRSL